MTKALTSAEIDRMRVEKGVCRHCGGPAPCWSEFGDQRVGVRHSTRTWKAMRSRALTQATLSPPSSSSAPEHRGGV